MKLLVFFATYNEAGNVTPLLNAISEVTPHADILVVDDSSSDGTVDIMRAMQMDHLNVIVRKGKLGLGSAHLLALAYARHNDYDVVVTIDGDQSHDPIFLPNLLKQIEAGSDLSVGSRYMPGGSCDYTGYRRHVSVLGNIAARFLLGIKLHEFTTSYRAFRVISLQRLDFSRLLVGGYSFFLTMIAEAASRDLRITETPIHFRERGYGVSKIPAFEAIRGIANLMRLAIRKRLLGTGGEPVANLSPCQECGTSYSFIVKSTKSGNAHAESVKGMCVFCGFHNA